MGKRIKVIELINGIQDGGAETLVRDYAMHIDRTKFDMHILTQMDPSCDSANVRVLRKSGISIHTPFIIRTSFAMKVCRWVQNRVIRPKFREQYNAWYLQNYILRVQPDVIHTHMTMLPYLLPIADKIKGIKLFYTCHSLPNRYFNDIECQDNLRAARYLISHNGLRFIALHEEMRKELNQMFGVNNTIVIRNCVDINHFSSVDKTKEQIRADLGIPQDAFVLGHVGRFIWLKNQPFIVDVLKALLPQKPNAFLLLVGDGDTEETLNRIERNGVTDRVLILSHRTDINYILKAMDVFVFPSALEGMPISCIEAQAAGLCCVISSNVTRDVCLSEHTMFADVAYGPARWAEIILNEEKGIYSGNISDFDIPQVMKSVEKLYFE